MAELTGFGYRAGRSILHRLDPRFKLLFLILTTLASLRAGAWGMLIMTGGLWGLLWEIAMTPAAIWKELRYFILLLGMVFAARALSAPGEPFLSLKFVTVTYEGLFDGALVCWRLLLIVLLGLGVTATTRPAEIRAAVEWALKPLPFIPAKRVGTMMGLTLRFIPVILNQAREMAEAQRARGVENRRNPAVRLLKLGLPLIRRTFESADRLVIAMESRCYSDSRSGPALAASRGDWIALALVTALGLLVMYIVP